MFAADLISGVPSFLIGPLALLYDGSDDIEEADCLLEATLLSGVPSFFSGPSQEDDVTAERLVCAGDAGFLAGLLTAKPMSGAPSPFNGVVPLPSGKAVFTVDGVLFTVYLMSGVPSFLRGTLYRPLSLLEAFVLFWKDDWP